MRSLGSNGIAPRYVATPLSRSDTDDTVRRSSVSLFFYIGASTRLRSSSKHSHLASSPPPPLCPFFRHPRRPSRSAPCRCPHSLSPCSRRRRRCPNSVSGSSSLNQLLFCRFFTPFTLSWSPAPVSLALLSHPTAYFVHTLLSIPCAWFFLSLYSCGPVCLVAIDPNEYAALLCDVVRLVWRANNVAVCGQGLDQRCHE